MKSSIAKWIAALSIALFAGQTQAFCGFYVAKADTKLFNKASKVVLVRDEQRTILTMSSDFQGDVKEFAMVVPVPVILQRAQIHVGKQATVDHLDAYTAPRLVEYFDPDPCAQPEILYDKMAPMMALSENKQRDKAFARSLGVTIEAQYTVGEYDILILSAQESTGLSTWLTANEYKIPAGAEQVLASYIKQDMKFFVAKVNLEEQAKLGFSYLRPLQMAFDSPKFMLPIRLGTVNANGPQELFIFALSRKGRVETTNYRTVKLPSDAEVPVYIKTEFSRFYQDLFAEQVKRQSTGVVFLEYAWDMNWCDPCAADPMSSEELRELGVFWTQTNGRASVAAQDVFVSRLHVRYSAATFPDDLQFQTTGDRSNYQGRYIIRHPWKGDASRCEAAKAYLEQLRTRQEKNMNTLANLTGWDINEIRTKIEWPPTNAPVPQESNWWEKLWQ